MLQQDLHNILHVNRLLLYKPWHITVRTDAAKNNNFKMIILTLNLSGSFLENNFKALTRTSGRIFRHC